ncbi:os-9-related [Anaeramoeba ignava]|uniref:Os-9-related n=1 Tax=Anaeramoeba ignava TaxID=1746090 RepID=A0A9Q0LTS3_ANAIG|nr:os-9-related [Anaeramoeba ignava]
MKFILLFLFILSFFYSFSFQNQNQNQNLNLKNSRFVEDFYSVSFLNDIKNIPFLNDSNFKVENFTSFDGTIYECFIPEKIGKTNTETNKETNKETKQNEITIPFIDKCFLAQSEENGWSYEVCYKKEVRQFKQVYGFIEWINSLGKFTKDEFTFKDNKIQITQYYESGTFCPEINKPRSLKVNYICLEEENYEEVSQILDTFIISIQETQTCTYEIIIASKFLCDINENTTINENLPFIEIQCFKIGNIFN